MCSTAARGTQVSSVGPRVKTKIHNVVKEGIMGSDCMVREEL